MLWAAKRCNYYVVNLLLEHGADPLLTDDQGFNLLHSATLDGNVYQLVLLLHQDIPVDIADPQSHTPLMWATKAETWALAEALGGAALVQTIREGSHSCYLGSRESHPWGHGCGACPACELRAKGWADYVQ